MHSLSITSLNRLELLKTALAWGCATAVVGTIVSALLMVISPLGSMQPSAKSMGIAAQGMAFFALAALVYAPIVETLIAQCLPIELLRKLRAPNAFIVLVCAVVFGLGHYTSNGVNHGIKTFVDGAIFGSLYLQTRKHSLSASYWVVAIAHFTNNLLVLSVGAMLIATGVL